MQEQLPRRTESEPRSVQTPAPARLPVSVVVPVKNEERNLGRCLAALTRFSEVIVVDSGSTDATPQIARNHGARLLQFVWDGAFPKKRNWVLLNHRFATDWVLFLDADEIVSESFCDEVEQAIRSGQHNGYWLNYSNHFLGRRLKYGVPQKKLALFRVGSGLYERIQEASWSKLDMEVHEHPVIEGLVGEIRATIEHNDFQGLGKFIDRHRDYAIWEAHRVLLLRREEILRNDTLTKRQTFKYRNIDRWWFAWFYFTYTYILKRGFLDGAAGFYHAFYKAWYFLSIRLLIAELRRQ